MDPADDYGRYPFYDGHVQERLRRADGNCVCHMCGAKYWRHTRDELQPYLNRMCDGSLVKL